MKEYEETQILALDVRHSRIGYALFSGRKRLLNWGASAVPVRCIDRAAWAHKRMAALLRHCSPASIVTAYKRSAKLPSNSHGEPILKAILPVFEKHEIPVHFLGRDELDTAFRVFKVRTKDDMACVLVRIFPELLIRLPPKRKTWQSEPHRMIIFDAIAIGFSFWQLRPHGNEPRASPPVPHQLA